MKILCSLSGLEFNCEHFPGTFYSKETFHPIFHLEQKKLIPFLKKWAGNELTPTDSYLLFLALLRSSDLVDFRVPAFRTEKTNSIIYNNMEFLARTVSRMNAVQNPAVHFSHIAITPDTRFLTNVHHWIENWNHDYEAFASGKAKDYEDRKEFKRLALREAALHRLIKNPYKDIVRFSNELAEWASIAGNFPLGNTPNPFTKLPTSIADFWKEIIRRCTRDELLYSIDPKDLAELIDHCEDNIPIGSIYSHALNKALRAALAKHKNFMVLGDFDLKTSYTILTEADDAESANMKALIDSAPETEPRREQYEKQIDFMRAQLRWKMKKRYADGEGK